MRGLTNCASRIKNGKPPKWSPCKCVMKIVFRIRQSVEWQSSTRRRSQPGIGSIQRTREEHVLNWPPLPKASPQPRNCSRIGALPDLWSRWPCWIAVNRLQSRGERCLTGAAPNTANSRIVRRGLPPRVRLLDDRERCFSIPSSGGEMRSPSRPRGPTGLNLTDGTRLAGACNARWRVAGSPTHCRPSAAPAAMVI